jgi:hypothetical protein
VGVLRLLATALAFGCFVPSLALATGPHTIVPGKSIGLVHLGELKADVHLGPSESNGSSGYFYRDRAITVAYQHGRVVAMSIVEGVGGSSWGYATQTHPAVGLYSEMAEVRSLYPHAQCAHHVLPGPPTKEQDNCLLRSHHGQTFFAGIAAKQGAPLAGHIGAILISAKGAGPQKP